MSQVLLKGISRKILIILGEANDKEEEKWDIDCANNYKVYFKSIAGGAYSDNDIEVLKNITLYELKTHISSLSVEDFAIVVYIGHGVNMDNYQLFALNNNEIIRPGERDLIPSVQQGIIILESCRSVTDGLEVTKTKSIPVFEKGGKLKSLISRDTAKRRYEKLLKNADAGIAILFPCLKDETADEYYFSDHLLQISNCLSKIQNATLTDVVDKLKSTFIEKYISQQPELLVNGSLPFVICVYKES